MASGESAPAASSGLVVPLVIWGSKPPDNKITTARYLSDTVTLWGKLLTMDQFRWECVTYSILVSVFTLFHTELLFRRFISASCDGHMCLWELEDGRCIDSISSSLVHRFMQTYTYKSSRHTRSTRLFCVGDYSDIVVMDPNDLAVVFNLSSRVEPDWICSYDIVRRTNKLEQCIGISMAGMIKIWSLVELEKKDLATPLYEDESKRLDLRDVKSVSFNAVNERLLLTVCSDAFHATLDFEDSSYSVPHLLFLFFVVFFFRKTKHFQMIDLDDLSIAISHECPVAAVNGKLLDVDKLAVTFVDQTLRIYQLPPEKLEGAQARQYFGVDPRNYFGISVPFEIAMLDRSKSNPRSNNWTFGCENLNGTNFQWLHDVTFSFANQENNQSSYQVARATQSGQLLIWKIPQFDKDFLAKFTSVTSFPLKYKGNYEESLGSIWETLNGDDKPLLPVLDSGDVTCSLFVSSQGKLLIGRADGLIVLTNACETLSCHLLEMPLDKPATRKLYGHKGRVFLSGADDFAIIIWNIVTGVRLYRFSVHGGPILRFLIPPSNTSKLISKCICAVAADHSVSLLNIRDMKCALLASQHPHPVSLVKWRPLDDFMLVKLDDGSVYVWEMATANMDRVVTGVAAEEVLTACDEQIGKEEGTDHTTASQAVVIMRALRYRGIDMMKGRSNNPESNNARSDSPPTTNEMGGVALGPPMSINQMPGCDQGTHLVQFEVGCLIGGIVHLDSTDVAHSRERPPSQTSEHTEPNEDALSSDFSRRFNHHFELKLYLDIARLLLSLLHGWNLDTDLDAVCLKKLGLNKPKQQLYFGNISRHGQLSVTLPQRIQHSFDHYSTCNRWQTSHSLTTTHLLAVISTANTLMGIRNSAMQTENVQSRTSVASQAQPNKKLVTDVPYIEAQQYKQGWSLLAALHCVLLPDHIRPRSSYAAPRIELLSRRWQDSCVEIREAAQALLIRELSRLGPAGRRRLIESWTPFLPPLLDPALSIFGARLQSSVPTLPPSAPPIPPRQRTSPPPLSPVPEPATGEDGESGIQQVRRNQATAIILLGVVGSEFGEELNRADMTRATALSLLELLVAAPSAILPIHSPLRRAAIDLLGRGFVYWEPHLEISKVVLGLLDLAGNTEKSSFRIPSAYFRPIVIGAPLSSIADACRTARHALTLIATARPTALLSALSMEVARYNAAAQHQTIQHTVVSPLLKSRSEVLRIIDELAEKRYNDVIEMMLPVGDVLVHCLDTSLLKQKTLADVFPPITKFPMVAYCASTRRIAFGGKNGTCVVHELRAAKAHSLQAHQGPVTAVAFSEDGKYLATYGGEDAKINFWQACQTFLGMGQSQMKLVKSQPAPAMQPVSPDDNGIVFRPKMVWINSKALTLMLPEGREQRFSI
ncbi:unnamed protein product [Angiostrongylus costaricensis]|uniref:WD_REPEATS_REGION domain-containing protein n=1 Tax=Angiostrongylus costaricensis TaxID=334426 RepID=A0A158PEP3_ANGCS|nr:unnamed protein product [Angiostrongylus costaricensis]